jgi:hypothetical protein
MVTLIKRHQMSPNFTNLHQPKPDLTRLRGVDLQRSVFRRTCSTVERRRSRIASRGPLRSPDPDPRAVRLVTLQECKAAVDAAVAYLEAVKPVDLSLDPGADVATRRRAVRCWEGSD